MNQEQESRSRAYFIAGNLVLAIALIMLFFFGPLWERLGVGALVLWMATAALGVFLIMKDQRQVDNPPL
ncbi:MAG: hypothetical protein ACOC00_08440 [Halothiobacillaceae bacterium]